MIESGHYASNHIRTVAQRLDRTWKQFAAGLDERTSVLALSVLFHHKAQQVCIFILKLNSLFYEFIYCFSMWKMYQTGTRP